MKIDPALCTIAHGFSHGKAKGKPPFPMLYMMMTSPLIPKAEALGKQKGQAPFAINCY